jgi:hypothetical protein
MLCGVVGDLCLYNITNNNNYAFVFLVNLLKEPHSIGELILANFGSVQTYTEKFPNFLLTLFWL